MLTYKIDKIEARVSYEKSPSSFRRTNKPNKHDKKEIWQVTSVVVSRASSLGRYISLAFGFRTEGCRPFETKGALSKRVGFTNLSSSALSRMSISIFAMATVPVMWGCPLPLLPRLCPSVGAPGRCCLLAILVRIPLLY